MPPVILGAALSAGFAAVSGAVVFGLSTTLSALVIGAGSLIMGGLQYALAPKAPKFSGSSNLGSTSSTVTLRQTDSTHKHIYGMTRFTDCYAQMVSTGANGKLHFVVIICADESESIDEVWADNYPISPDDLDTDGNVISGRYAGNMRIRKHLGSPDQVADTVMVAEVDGWTTNCRLRGITYLYLTLTKNQDVYPNGVPNISCIGKFRKIYDPRTLSTRWTPNLALFGYDFLNRADFGFEAADDDIDLVNIAAQANIADEIVDTVDLDMPIASVDAGTDIITLTGDVLAFEICDRVEIITTGTAPGGLATGTDYYIIPYQIQTRPRIKLAASLDDAIAGVAINITSAGTGANTVRKNGEPRYHGAGVIDTADTLQDSMNAILSGLAGRACLTGGAWRLIAGAWQEPTLSFDVGDLRGGVSVRSKVAMSDRFNTVGGLFTSQINSYQPADYPPYRNQEYIDADLNEYPKDYPLRFTTRPTTAKRIAKLETLRSRLEKLFNASFSLSAMQAQSGDNVMISYDRRGWEDKVFEVTNFGFQIVQGDDNNQQLLTSLQLRETDESIYYWAASEDDPPIVFAPNTNLPDPFTVFAVTGVSYSSRAVTTTGGDTVYSLVMHWDQHPDAFVVNDGQIEIQFKLSADADWRPGFFVAGSLTFTDVLVSSVNVEYDLRIRAINNLGVRSSWTTILNAIIGTSGGVVFTNDWGSVADSVGGTNDWGSVADVVGSTNDWGFVV